MSAATQRLAATLTSALIVCAGGAWAQTDTDLVMLPAPAGAWRTFVGHWESQAELTGASVVVARPTAEYARDSRLGASAGGTAGRRETLLLDWSGLWSSWLRIESPQPLDLRPWLGGTLEMDLHVADLAKGGVKVKVSCGNGCERAVVLDQARAMEGKGWQHVALAMNCFVRDGADFSKVTMPFMGWSLVMNTAQVSPSSTSQKYSKELKFSATSASAGAARISTSVPNSPPTAEKISPAPSASSAWPLRVMAKASSV